MYGKKSGGGMKSAKMKKQAAVAIAKKKKQAATAIAMKKAGKKPKKKR